LYEEEGDDVVWQETGLDLKELTRLRWAIYTAEIGRDIIERPVHPLIEPCADPDSLTFDMSEAETRGEPVDPADYPPGTWFYWGEDKVCVRLAGSEKIARVEFRG
jgi:hypothetical protein